MHIHIIIPVHNRIESTKIIIDCLRKQTIRNLLKIIVVDDGSTDETVEWLKKQPDIEILYGNGNLLWAGAVNLAIKKLLNKYNKNDWLLLINNDVEIKNNYVEILYKIARNNFPAAIGSVVKNDKEEIISLGAKIFRNSLEVKEIYNNYLNFEKLDTLNNVDVLSGRGVLYPLSSIKLVNGLRPNIIPHYFADYELSLRVKKRGYNLIISTKAAVYSNEDFNLIQKNRKNESIIFKLFARKSSSLCYSKFFFWWEANSFIGRISLPLRIIKFIILPGTRKNL